MHTAFQKVFTGRTVEIRSSNMDVTKTEVMVAGSCYTERNEDGIKKPYGLLKDILPPGHSEVMKDTVAPINCTLFLSRRTATPSNTADYLQSGVKTHK